MTYSDIPNELICFARYGQILYFYIHNIIQSLDNIANVYTYLHGTVFTFEEYVTLRKDLWLQMDGIATKCSFCQPAFCRIPLAFQKK